jgi:hypothetical protein
MSCARQHGEQQTKQGKSMQAASLPQVAVTCQKHRVLPDPAPE